MKTYFDDFDLRCLLTFCHEVNDVNRRKEWAELIINEKPKRTPIDVFEYLLNTIPSIKSINQQKRNQYFKGCVILYNCFEEINAKYTFNETKHYITDRFIRRDFATPAFEDGIDYNAPKEKGLYFIGATHFNPFTNEQFYWVKIGKSENLYNRMKSYDSTTAMLWRIDFSKDYDKETEYHNKLLQNCINTCNHNDEWYRVDRETYLAMSEKGFDYFN